MNINGFALIQIADGALIARWETVPGRIDLPNQDVLMSADAGWSNDLYKIETYSWTEPDPVPPRRLVSKADIVDRLYTSGHLDAARAALDAADLYTRERWNTRDSIYADDPVALGLLKAIGADPTIILA